MNTIEGGRRTKRAEQKERELLNNIYVCGFFASRRRRHYAENAVRPPSCIFSMAPETECARAFIMQLWPRVGHRVTRGDWAEFLLHCQVHENWLIGQCFSHFMNIYGP